MSAFNGIIAAATETTGIHILTLLAAVIYSCIFSYLIWAATSAEQRLNATGYQRGKGADVKTSRAKPKKSTSATVRMNDNIKNTSTAQLQVCNSCGPKSDTIVYNIKRSSNLKMDHQRQEEDFITVVSKHERRRLQHEKKQQEKMEKEQQLKTQKQQIKQEKQSLKHQDEHQQKKLQEIEKKQQQKPDKQIKPKKLEKPQEVEKQQKKQEEELDLEKQQAQKNQKKQHELEKQQEKKYQEEQPQLQKQDKQLQKKIERQHEKNNQEEQQKLEKQQEQQNQEERKELEKQQQLKKKQPQEKQQQLNKQRHDNPLQQEIITSAINEISVTLIKSPKTAVLHNEQSSYQSCQFNNKKLEVNVTNAERDVHPDELQAKHSMMTNTIDMNLENLGASQSTQVSRDAVVEATRIEDYSPIRDFDKNNEDLENLEIEIITTKGIHEHCKEHDITIKDLREENEKMRVKYESSMKNNWTDSEFKIVLEGVRAEIEMKRLDTIKKLADDHQAILEELKTEHDAEVKGLHMYYQSMLSNIQMDHNLAVGAIHMNHEILINDLRNINYGQSQRHETAMQSMREVKDKMSKEHQNEVRGLREKYENTIKDLEIAISNLINEKEVLRAEHEKVVRELCEKNDGQHHTTIKAFTNGQDDKDADNRTATIIDDDDIDVFKTQNSTLDHTVKQKLIQLLGRNTSNNSDRSSDVENLQQKLNDVKVDALQLNACSPQKNHDNSKDVDKDDESDVVVVAK